jgi:hemerythrin-like domain-containing protein
MESLKTRRDFLRASAVVGTGLVLSSCAGSKTNTTGKEITSPTPDENKMGGEVTATEDLMREHGILRRALLVYSATAIKLRGTPPAIAPDALQKTATLFKAFGEEYHEKKLEEAYIFPAVKKAGGEAANYSDILVVQHNRGREITDYIISVTQGAKLGANNAEPLAKALEAFVLMYRNHAAREDTIIFPAWKQTMTGKQLDERTTSLKTSSTSSSVRAGSRTPSNRSARLRTVSALLTSHSSLHRLHPKREFPLVNIL